MSKIVTTELGRFRGVTDGTKSWWLWECPNCKTWGNLSVDQMEGRVRVQCDAPKQYHYPTTVGPCGYHETHNYARKLVAVIQARALVDGYPFEEDNDEPKPTLFVQTEDGKFVPYEHKMYGCARRASRYDVVRLC